ncbi:alcohol dehydrogenase catalytic domain-containing protein [Virgibacillus sp. NKC19-3]|uniref:zinc-binding dehydrogenase n=1 Tax=Virgibacillus saliphilus TaxID=2831674 RepID=UPI001C9A6CA9|nr:alcohol dehydrogenase catalytic domain-containing protein [Virgibacillus sp. NKC19-3]MBY7142927.1 alcohol dehydrogenase catalytic domain-containing protein [Virgibacillus sp. NKC19-3]
MSNKEIVQSRAYRLIAPETFEEVVLQHSIDNNQVVVQPSLASICHADTRYYTGQRRKEALQSKLPMALFHEGIGHIVKSKDETFDIGQRVVIVPNIPARRLQANTINNKSSPNSRVVKDNYLPQSVFLGSGYDGIGQQNLVLPKENVIAIPSNVPDEIAVLAELTSVSLHAANHVSDYFNDGKVAVFGDGPVGYLTAATLHHVFGISKEDLLVFGAISERLVHFDFATTYLVQDFNFRKEENVVAVIECTGGTFSEKAINQAIDLIEPQGKITLMGVSEEHVPLNTRDILEKGLTIYGSSRSTAEEFQTLMHAFQSQAYQRTLEKLLPNQKELIRDAKDLEKSMNKAIKNKGWGKIFLSFEWG